MRTATFIGHRDCHSLNRVKLRNVIESLVKDGYKRFLCGGMGNFDMLCASIVHELKKQYTDINCILVIPYLTFSIQEEHLFDEILYPDGFENYFFKRAIIKRNEYLIENSTVAVCYVEHDWGGAAKTYDLAVKKKLQIVNLGEL